MRTAAARHANVTRLQQHDRGSSPQVSGVRFHRWPGEPRESAVESRRPTGEAARDSAEGAGHRAAGQGVRPVRPRCGAAAEPGDGASSPGGSGASACAVPAQYEAERGHRRPPRQPYGRCGPARPGEHLLRDTTRVDMFAFDPLTLRWVRAGLTVAMDWYTRCITGLRLTPVSTKIGCSLEGRRP